MERLFRLLLPCVFLVAGQDQKCTTETCHFDVQVNYIVNDVRVTGLFPTVNHLIGALKPQAVVTDSMAAGVHAGAGLPATVNVGFVDLVPVGFRVDDRRLDISKQYRK